MPCLNADILFEIGKKIVEDGDSDAVYRFALSGKEPLNAMLKVFASVASLELSENYYDIGWGKKVCRFKFEKKKPLFNCLVNQIGNRVDNLYVDCIISLNKNWLNAFFKKTFGHHNTVYWKILDRIIAKKQLISFSAGENCGQKFFDEFLPKFSATLKNVTVPCGKMSSTFQKSNFDLDKLTVFENGNALNLRNCCKTKSLEAENSTATLATLREIHIRFFIPDFVTMSSFQVAVKNVLMRFNYSFFFSPHFSSVKELIINESEFRSFRIFLHRILHFFPSLENVRFNYSPESPVHEFVTEIFFHYSTLFMSISTKIPSNVTFSLNYDELVTTLSEIRGFFAALEMQYDESITEYYCFRKTFENDDGVHSNVEFQIHS